MKLMYADNEKKSVIVEYDNGDFGFMSYPPVHKEDKKLVDEYGGEYQIEKTWVDHCREVEAMEKRWERFQKQEEIRSKALSIDEIMEEELTPSDLMKIKMSIFSNDIVKNSKSKENLSGLRKAENIVDIMMYYGLIRNEYTISGQES